MLQEGWPFSRQKRVIVLSSTLVDEREGERELEQIEYQRQWDEPVRHWKCLREGPSPLTGERTHESKHMTTFSRVFAM
jgi:hypothetical protein